MFETVTRIAVPDWAPSHARGEVRYADGFTEQDAQALHPRREAVLALLHSAVLGYLRRAARSDRGGRHFPHADRLTGEYYIGSEVYSREDAAEHEMPPRYLLRFGVRCLQEPRPPYPLEPSDYLGLHVLIHCDPTDGWRMTIHATDSSVI